MVGERKYFLSDIPGLFSSFIFQTILPKNTLMARGLILSVWDVARWPLYNRHNHNNNPAKLFLILSLKILMNSISFASTS